MNERIVITFGSSHQFDFLDTPCWALSYSAAGSVIVACSTSGLATLLSVANHSSLIISSTTLQQSMISQTPLAVQMNESTLNRLLTPILHFVQAQLSSQAPPAIQQPSQQQLPQPGETAITPTSSSSVSPSSASSSSTTTSSSTSSTSSSNPLLLVSQPLQLPLQYLFPLLQTLSLTMPRHILLCFSCPPMPVKMHRASKTRVLSQMRSADAAAKRWMKKIAAEEEKGVGVSAVAAAAAAAAASVSFSDGLVMMMPSSAQQSAQAVAAQSQQQQQQQALGVNMGVNVGMEQQGRGGELGAKEMLSPSKTEMGQGRMGEEAPGQLPSSFMIPPFNDQPGQAVQIPIAALALQCVCWNRNQGLSSQWCAFGAKSGFVRLMRIDVFHPFFKNT